MRLTPRLLIFLLSLLSVGSLGAETLTVAVAANMQYAFEALKTAFTRETGISVQAVYGSSGKLSAQIQNGAPYDIFISADTDYPESLYKAGYCAELPRIYAYGKLVLWTLQDWALDPRLSILADRRVARIALPNPQLAPYGREALRAIEAAKLKQQVEAKLVYGESIGQAAQYIATGAVDLGFTAMSVVRAPEIQSKGKWVEVDPTLYTPIAQAVVILKSGAAMHPRAVPLLANYLLSAPARILLAQYGYGLP